MKVRKNQEEKSENRRTKQIDTERHMVDVSDALLTAAASRYSGAVSEVPTHRETMSQAVAEFLPFVISRLQEAGLTARATGRRRPRNVDAACWKALQEAESTVALSSVEVLRCCLVLAGRRRERSKS